MRRHIARWGTGLTATLAAVALTGATALADGETAPSYGQEGVSAPTWELFGGELALSPSGVAFLAGDRSQGSGVSRISADGTTTVSKGTKGARHERRAQRVAHAECFAQRERPASPAAPDAGELTQLLRREASGRSTGEVTGRYAGLAPADPLHGPLVGPARLRHAACR
jgi:hypothetical protein